MTELIDGRELYQLREIAAINGALHKSAEGDVSAVHALVARWEQGVANLYAANEKEGHAVAAIARAARAEEIERCTRELCDALSAPESPCPRCEGSMIEPGSEDYDPAVHMHNPTTGEPCSACNGTGSAPESQEASKHPEGGPVHVADWLESERSRNE